MVLHPTRCSHNQTLPAWVPPLIWLRFQQIPTIQSWNFIQLPSRCPVLKDIGINLILRDYQRVPLRIIGCFGLNTRVGRERLLYTVLFRESKDNLNSPKSCISQKECTRSLYFSISIKMAFKKQIFRLMTPHINVILKIKKIAGMTNFMKIPKSDRYG